MAELTNDAIFFINEWARTQKYGRSSYRDTANTRDPKETTYKKSSSGMNLLNAAIGKTTDSITLMQKTTDQFVFSMTRYLRSTFGGAMVADVIDGALSLGKTYTKLTDIGQTFNGSVLDMAAKAGESGLSLDEYTKFLTRNSTVAATQGATAMGQLQLSVRNALKPMGFFGMSLTELTDMTGDYAETLRLSGVSQQSNTEQQTRMVQKLATDVSTFSQLTGKAREAILKDLNAAMRDPSAAMRMVREGWSEQQKTAYQGIATFFSSLPGVAGQELPKFFAQLTGTGNAAFTQLGNAAIRAGMPQINAGMQQLQTAMRRGGADVSKLSVHTVMQMRDAIVANDDSLQNLINAGGEAGAAAQQIQALGASLIGLDEKQLAQKLDQLRSEQEQQKALQKVTANIIMFESNLHEVTGAFRLGFYGAWSKALENMDFGGKNNYIIENLKKAMGSLGEAFGKIVSAVFSPQNIEFLTTQIGVLADWLASIASDKDLIKWIESLEQAIISLFKAIRSVFNTIEGAFEWMGMSKGTSTIATIGAMFFGPSILASIFKNVLGMVFQRLLIRAAVVNVTTGALGGALGDTLSNLAGGGPAGGRAGRAGAAGGRWFGPPPAPGMSFAGRAGWRMAGVAQSLWGAMGGSLAKELTAADSTMAERFMMAGKGAALRGGVASIVGSMVELAGDALIDAVPIGDQAQKESTKSLLSWTVQGAAVGAMAGPWGALVGGLIGAAAGLYVQHIPNDEQLKQQYKDELVKQGAFSKKADTGEIRTDLMPIMGAQTKEDIIGVMGGAVQVTELARKLTELEQLQQRDVEAMRTGGETAELMKELRDIAQATKILQEIQTSILKDSNDIQKDQAKPPSSLAH